MNPKFSYAIKFLKIQYWKLEEQILKLQTENPDNEGPSYVHDKLRDLRNDQYELDCAIKLLEENQ